MVKPDGITKDQVLTGALCTSLVANVAMANQMDKYEKRTENALKVLNRASLIATYYVLKKDPTNQFKHSKEETNMKKFNIGSKFSNRTKVIGSVALAFTIGAAASAVHDVKVADVAADELIELEIAPEAVEAAVEDAAEVINF